MGKHMYDFGPYSRGRMKRILEIYEVAYYYRRLRTYERTKKRIYEVRDEMEMNNSEVIFFLDVVNNHSFKDIRQYLLENGSKIVRRGKKTRVRKKVKQ